VRVEVESVAGLRFDDGSPVRAASAVVGFGGGWLVAQDDATHGAWVRAGGVTRVRLLPPVRGLDTFEEAAGTKVHKPDLEAAFAVADGMPGRDGSVVLLGSGSSPARMRGVLVRPPAADGSVDAAPGADLTPLYAAVARALGVEPDLLNLEGACVVRGALRWFQRGLPSGGVPTASVDVDLGALLAVLTGEESAHEVPVTGARAYVLGDVHGVGLAVTDAVALPGGSVLVSAAAEDTTNPRDDGPVVGSALALLDGAVLDVAVPDRAVLDRAVPGAAHPATDRVVLPEIQGAVAKVEGLAVVEHGTDGVRLLATVDADDSTAPSLAVGLQVRW
jgi:hypothetical protein